MNHYKKLVLQSFKKLHRARKKVFAGDEKALVAARLKINEEYSKNKHVKDEEAIKVLIKLGEDVANELKTQVIQAKQTKPGVFKVKITNDTMKLENIPFNESSILEENISNNNRPCCKNNVEGK